MTYKTQAYSALFGFPVDLDTDEKLRRAIDDKSKIDFADCSTGGATIVGKLHCNPDGSFTFEGLTGKQEFPVGENIDRLLAHWPGFAKAQEDRHETDKIRWRSECPCTPSEKRFFSDCAHHGEHGSRSGEN